MVGLNFSSQEWRGRIRNIIAISYEYLIFSNKVT